MRFPAIVTLGASCALALAACSNGDGAPPGCGDGELAFDEVCDGEELGGRSCSSLGRGMGALRCTDRCQLDTSGCSNPDPIECGDGVAEIGEQCDGDDLNGVDCEALERGTGSLTCDGQCRFDTSGCSDPDPIECGNGMAEPGEQCDMDDLDGADCEGQGFAGGTLGCDGQCRFDTTECIEVVATCGDGVAEGDETCDMDDLGGERCETRGFVDGTLACSPDCQSFDTSGCHRCGDGTVQQADGEECDGANLDGASCTDQDPALTVGEPTCTGSCTLDYSNCREPDPGDDDGDGVDNDFDPDPNDPTVCGDDDGDGCDDCSIHGEVRTDDDGWDRDGDGQCEYTLDYDCMNGANAASDPWRREACLIFTHMNDDRAHFDAESGGGTPLVWNEALWEIAIAHSENMCNQGIFDHDIDGDGPGDRAAAAGISGGISENISVNLDPSAAQYGWMNEPTCVGHRGAILSPRSQEVGIGYYDCNRSGTSYDWEDHHHITADFITNWSVSDSAYCQDPATHCEVPADPPTTAVCPAMLVDWGFCPAPDASLLTDWECPSD